MLQHVPAWGTWAWSWEGPPQPSLEGTSSFPSSQAGSAGSRSRANLLLRPGERREPAAPHGCSTRWPPCPGGAQEENEEEKEPLLSRELWGHAGPHAGILHLPDVRGHSWAGNGRGSCLPRDGPMGHRCVLSPCSWLCLSPSLLATVTPPGTSLASGSTPRSWEGRGGPAPVLWSKLSLGQALGWCGGNCQPWPPAPPATLG